MKVPRATNKVMRHTVRQLTSSTIPSSGVKHEIARQSNRRGQYPVLRQYVPVGFLDSKWTRTSLILRAFCEFMQDGLSMSNSTIDLIQQFDCFDSRTLARGGIYLKKSTCSRGIERSLCKFIIRFFVCNVIAMKYQEDAILLNDKFARDWGLSTRLVNFVEADTLACVDYDVYIDSMDIYDRIRTSYEYEKWWNDKGFI